MCGKINIGAYYVSQYLWIMYLGVPIILSFIFQERTNKSLIHSSNSFFNNSKDPVIVAHLTDTHLNYVGPDRVATFRGTIRSLGKILPELIIFTGDIVDNYDFISFPRFGDQHEEDWQIYKEEISKFPNIPIVDIPGNHDMFGIIHLFSQKNFLLEYSKSFNRVNVHKLSDLHVKSFLFEKLNLTIITMNPFNFPTAHPSLHYFQYVTKEDLDQIEGILKNSKTNNIIISHYPLGLLYSNVSSSGKKFEDIIGSDSKVLAYLSGHTHPKVLDSVHHGNGGIELIGPCNYQNSNYGVITIDNGCLAWSLIEYKNPAKGVISYPIPIEQLTPKTIFNDIENAEIRVVMFTDRNDLSISFTISGDSTFSGKLRYSRTFLNQTKSLYVFPLKDCIKRNGNYTITFSGDFESSLNFVISDTFVVGGEINPELRYTNKLAFITYPIFFFALLLITCPIKWNVSFDEIENWIETSDPFHNYWYFAIFFGFLLVRHRFQKAPKIIRYVVFCCVFMTWFCPVLIFETEGVKGFIWSFGYVIQNKFMRTNWGVYFAYIYLAVICFPMISLCSSFALKNWTAKVAAGDLAWALFCVGGTIVLIVILVHEAAGEYWYCSLCYIIVPILFVSMIFIWRIYEYNYPSDDYDASFEIDLTDSIN